MNSEDKQNPDYRPKWLGFDFFEEKLSQTELEQDIADQASFDSSKSFPLAMASIGESLQIIKLKGSEGMVRRLIGMGLAPGCQVQVISNTGGSVIVAIGDNRIGLGTGMAQKIMCTNKQNG